MPNLQESIFNLPFNQTPRKNIFALKASSKLSQETQNLLNNTSNMDNEENPTHFIELNNTSYDSDVKIIKVKIIVPKGTLNNSKFDHKRNVLTAMNDIDKITFNVRATTEHSSEILKITNILNSGDLSNESTIKEDSSVRIVSSKPKQNYPVMGTNALLVKTNSVRNTEPKLEEPSSLSDSVIIQGLVNERYQDNMIELYQRSFIRQTSRGSSIKTNSRTTSENSVDKDVNYNFVNNIKHSSTMLNEMEEICDSLHYLDTPEPLSLEYGTAVDDLENFEDVKITQPRESEYSTIQNKDVSFNSSDFHVDVTLGSAIDFILSTNGNPLNTSPYFCTKNNSAKDSVNSNATPQSRSDFDEDKFLQRALGEELNGYASTDSCMKEDKMEQIGSSELDTNDTSYVSSRSVNSSDVSLLLSKASSLYSTVSCKIRHLGKRLPIHSSEGTISEETDHDASSMNTTSTGLQANARMTRLMQDSVIQYQVIVQTGKALTYCRTVKEFVGSSELIQAERMLLLATCKRQSILDTIRKLEYEDEHHQHNSRGTITISNLVFHPKENTQPKVESGRSKKAVQENLEWFVCIINCNEFTYATEAKMVGKDGFVRFGDEKFEFNDLAMDVDVKVTLYAIKVKNGLRSYSHESKYHLKKETSKPHSILCPPAPSTSFLQHLTLTRPPSSNSTSNTPGATTKPSFIPYGSSTLRLNHLTQNSKDNSNQANCYRLTKMPAVASSRFSGVFSAEVKTAIVVKANGAGFMTVGTNGHDGKVTTWSRHWCELVGTELRWWNYPQVEGVERIEALGSIDLRTCVSARITSVDRNICARPRTLLLETSSYNCDAVINRYLFSCDNTHDMQVWESKLNNVVGILRSWNAMDTRNKMYCSKILYKEV